MWERKFLEAVSGMGELSDVVERGDGCQCEEGEAAPGGSEAEAAVSETEWLPLIWNALATAKQGKLGKRTIAASAPGSAGGESHGSRRPGELAGWTNGPSTQESDVSPLPCKTAVACCARTWRARSWPRWYARSWLGLWQRRQVRSSMELYREGEGALSFRRMLADCSSRKRRGARQQCFSRTWPAHATLPATLCLNFAFSTIVDCWKAHWVYCASAIADFKISTAARALVTLCHLPASQTDTTIHARNCPDHSPTRSVSVS